MKKAAVFVILIVIFILFELSAAAEKQHGKGQQPPADPKDMKLEEVLKETRGNWTGRGMSEEVRFRQQLGLLTLTVKHAVEFYFHVNEKGEVEGDGTITFDLVRETSGLDALVSQVRGLMAAVMTPARIPGTSADAGKVIHGQLQYDAPHLKNGPELRHFTFKGRIEQGREVNIKDDGWIDQLAPPERNTEKVITLEPVLAFTLPDGTPNSTLTAAWEVNGKKEEKDFPCWSPFLKGPAILRRGPGGYWLAEFRENGTHRDDKSVWQEYGYVWMARQLERDQAPASQEKPEGKDKKVNTGR